MSLRLLVDEDTQAKELVARLRAAGHNVLTAAEAGLNTQDDAPVVARATVEGRVVLTRNCDDFRLLHESNPDHHGILAIYRDRDPTKNMTYAEIVQAIARLDASGYELRGQFLVLNAWRGA